MAAGLVGVAGPAGRVVDLVAEPRAWARDAGIGVRWSVAGPGWRRELPRCSPVAGGTGADVPASRARVGQLWTG